VITKLFGLFWRPIGWVLILAFGGILIVVPMLRSPTYADQLLAELNTRNPSLKPEVLEATEWTFWCTGGDPGMLSGGTEFLAAQEFAAKNGLAFIGPKVKTSETLNYNLIFVRADGTYSEKKLTKFSFVWNFGDEVCWRRSESIVALIEKGRLRVEKKSG
jgi:hypothetical protein